MKALRIVFCVLSCLCVAASIFVGIFCGWEWFFLVVAFAAVFAGGMIWAKKKTDPPQPTVPDFIMEDEKNGQTDEKPAEGEQNTPDGEKPDAPQNSEPPQNSEKK